MPRRHGLVLDWTLISFDLYSKENGSGETQQARFDEVAGRPAFTMHRNSRHVRVVLGGQACLKQFDTNLPHKTLR